MIKQQLLQAVLVGFGGGAGSLFRFGVNKTIGTVFPQVPLGTFIANVAGCFIIGCVYAATEKSFLQPSHEMRLLLATGFCGGFTTMSSFIYEMSGQLGRGEYLTAALYLTGTLLVCMMAFLGGSGVLRLF